MDGKRGRTVVLALLAGTTFIPTSGRAQDPGPSWRVGRLAAIGGSVATHGSGQTDWTAATPNMPLQAGDAIWAAGGAGARIEVQRDVMALDGVTELDIAALDGSSLGLVEPQGRLFLDLYRTSTDDLVTVTTPRGAVRLALPGRYEIDAGNSDAPTRIAVVAGTATISSGSFSLAVSAGQMAGITGDTALDGHVDALSPDPFLTAQLRALAAPGADTPAAVCAMTGGASLGGYGHWTPQPGYGAVWFPQVAADWVPYREGHWTSVAPWGWTWVDDEPWGFAPFHYGRWSQFDGRWGWIPMEPDAPPVAVAEPAYAPALVDFLAAGAVAGAVAGFAAGGSIGWVPLGPHEPYRPPYAVGAPYRQHLTFNRVDIDARRTEINQVIEINRYDNRRGFTVMPAAAMARSEAVPHPGPNPSALPAGYRSLRGEAALPPPGAPANRVAAGPRIDPALFRPRDLPASRTPFRDARPPGQQLPPANPAMGHPMAGPIHAVAVPAGGAPVPHPPEAARLDTGPSAPNGLPALRRAGEVPAGAPAGPGRTEHPRPLAQDQRPEAPPHPNPFPASRPAVMPRPPAQAEPAAHGTSGHDGPARGTAGGPPDAPGFRSQSPRPDFPRMEPPHAQPPRAEPFRAEPVRTPGPRDGFRAEPPRQLEHPEPARAQPPRPAPPRPEPPRPEPFRPAPHPPAPPHPPTQARPEPPHGEHRPPG